MPIKEREHFQETKTTAATWDFGRKNTNVGLLNLL